jgi:recombination protein RecA
MAKASNTPEKQIENRAASLLASDWMSKIKKKWGDSIVDVASESKHIDIHRIPTGVFPLDYALGGGFPVGRVNVCFGQKSSAKTTTVLKAIGQGQKLCGNCYTPKDDAGSCACGTFRELVAAFIDIEGTFDRKWAEANGVQMDRLLLSRPDYAEQGLDIAEAMIRSGECDIIAIDSIAFLTSMKEIEESTEKDQVGTQARLLGKGIRKFVAALNTLGNETGRKPTVFLINQLRMKVGLLFGNPETQPGGMAPGFAASTEVKFWSGKYVMDDETKRPLSVAMNFRVEKNKTAAPKMEGEFQLILSETEHKKLAEVEDEPFVLKTAEKIGLVERQGTTWHVQGRTFRVKADMEAAMLADPDLNRELRNALMHVLLSTT